jgi:TonB-dependent receptor
MYEYDDRFSLNLIGFHSQLADNDTRSYHGYYAPQDGILHTTRLQFISRALDVLQLHGKNLFDELGDSQLDWKLSYSVATRSEPDTRDVVYIYRDDYRLLQDGEVTETPAWVYIDGSESGSHFFSEQVEESKAVVIDWTQPVVKGDAPTSVKLGAAMSVRDREFFARRMALRSQPSERNGPAFVCLGEEWDDSCPDQLFLRRNIGPLLYLQEGTRPEDSYTADLDVYATYLMTDAHLSRDLRLITGGRVEVTDQRLDPTDPLGIGADIQGAELRSTDLLPALSLVYSATSKSKLRFSVTRTLARPQLRELAPFAYADFFGGRQTAGNPDLRLTRITNADLRFEIFPKLSEVVAFSVFYKHFFDAIEPVVGASGDSGLITFQNAPDANLIGVELESRIGLRRLASELHPFAVVSNLTLARSRIQVDQTDRDYLTNLSRPMVNQAPYVFNLALDYEHDTLGIQSRVSYNLRGPQLVRVGARGLDDSWKHPTHTLDYNVSKQLGHGFKVKLKVTNILNTVHVQTIGRERHAWNVERRYRDGIGLGIGASYKY